MKKIFYGRYIFYNDLKNSITMNNKNKKITIMTSITLLALVIGLSSVPGAMAGVPVTIVVDDDGKVGVFPPVTAADCDGANNIDADFDNIQDAYDDANQFDTVIVCPGTYNESVDVDQEEDVTIEGIAKPKVDGSSPAFDITEDGTHVTGFEVTTDDGDCIEIDADDVRIHGIITTGCDDDGIDADGERITISGNRLNGNDDNGIECDNCDEAVIRGNVVNDNNDGIKCSFCDDSVIQGNTANGNSDDGIELSSSSDDNLVRGNTANGNGDNGIEIRGEDNIIRNNDANNNDDDGIHVKGSSDENDVTHNNTNDNTDNGIQNDGTNNTFDKNRCRNNGTGSTPSELCKPQGFA